MKLLLWLAGVSQVGTSAGDSVRGALASGEGSGFCHICIAANRCQVRLNAADHLTLEVTDE
jgi:hypothetical protein